MQFHDVLDYREPYACAAILLQRRESSPPYRTFPNIIGSAPLAFRVPRQRPNINSVVPCLPWRYEYHRHPANI